MHHDPAAYVAAVALWAAIAFWWCLPHLKGGENGD